MSNNNNNSYLTFTIPPNANASADANAVNAANAANADPLKILIHQATTTDDDQGDAETNTGFVMWPSAVLLSHHISQHPEIISKVQDGNGDDANNGGGGDIMELGAGCGLPGLTAAAMLQKNQDDSNANNSNNNSSSASGETSSNNNDTKVIFTDYNPAVLENLKQNIELNEFDVSHEVYGLDWFHQQPAGHNDDDEDRAGVMKREENIYVERKANTWVDTEGKSHDQLKLILGADLIVCSNDSDLVAHTLDASLAEGGMAVILGPSADRRFGVAEFPNSCRELGMKVDVEENILEAREDGGEKLMEELEMGGHNQRACTFGNDFTMFTIHKPVVSSR